MNRAVAGDLVVVELLPEGEWRSPNEKVVDADGASLSLSSTRTDLFEPALTRRARSLPCSQGRGPRGAGRPDRGRLRRTCAHLDYPLAPLRTRLDPRRAADRPRRRHPPPRVAPLRLHPARHVAPRRGVRDNVVAHGDGHARAARHPLDPDPHAPGGAARRPKIPRLDRPVGRRLAPARGPLCARARRRREQGGRGREPARGVGGAVPPVLERHHELPPRGGRQVGRAGEGLGRRRQGRVEKPGGPEGRDHLLDRPAWCVLSFCLAHGSASRCCAGITTPQPD